MEDMLEEIAEENIPEIAGGTNRKNDPLSYWSYDFDQEFLDDPAYSSPSTTMESKSEDDSGSKSDNENPPKSTVFDGTIENASE